jgi:hypothetical protein
MSRHLLIAAAMALSAHSSAQAPDRPSPQGPGNPKPGASTFVVVPLGGTGQRISGIAPAARPPGPGDLPGGWISAEGSPGGRFVPNFPPASAEAKAAEQTVLAFLVRDPKSASVSLAVADWICVNPGAVAARIVTLNPYVLTDHDDGGWGVDSDVLMDIFRRPVSVPALHGFVHSPCPKSFKGEGKCEGGLSLEVNNALLTGWDSVLAHEAADSLNAGTQCRIRLLQALTRWFQPKAQVYLPPQPERVVVD